MPGSIIFALEPAYGTRPSSGWKDPGVNGDGHKSKRETIKRNVLRRRIAAPLASDNRTIDKGGEGTVDIDGISDGLGVFLACAASTAESSNISGSAYEQVFEWTADGVPSGRSLAALKFPERRDGTEDCYAFGGGKVTSVEIGSNLDGFVTVKMPVDYAPGAVERLVGTDLTDATGYADAAEVIEPTWVYAWEDALITLTPTAGGPGETECLSSFTLTLDGALDLEDWCMKRGDTKHEPSRKATPGHAGTLEWKYEHPRYYDAFVSGATFSVTAEWEGPVEIETGIYPSLTIELGEIGFEEANDPEMSPTEATAQSMPFMLYDDGTGVAARVTLVTADSTDLNVGS